MNNRQPTVRRHTDPETNSALALVIAKNESERIFVKAALEGLLCDLRFSNSRRDALAMLAAESIAVVIVDGDAKAPSWRELLEQVSSNEAGPAPKFIVVSRWADDRMWAEALNLGAYDLLPRPLNADEVAWVVRSALSERNGAHTPIEPADLKGQGAWNGS